MEASTTNPLERRLDLTVELAEIEKGMDQQLKRLGKNVKLPGFRPGKVPMNILRQYYGERAHHESFNEVINRIFFDAIKSGNYRLAGQPRIEPKQSESKTHIEVTAVFEVYPEFKLGDLSSAEIERPTLEIGKAEIDQTLEILRQQRVRHEPADRAAAKDDRVVIDFTGKKNGELFEGGNAKDYPFVLGQGTMLADFEKAIEGMKAGETKSFDMTFPESYFSKDLAGQPVTFEITVKQVMAPVLPEVDAEFAKSLGIKDGDLTKMHAEIETNLKREVKRRVEEHLKNQAMEALLKANPIDIPNSLIEMETQRMMQRAAKDLEQRGLKTKDIPIQPEWFTDQAKRHVSLGLILAEVVQTEKLEAKPEQVRTVIEDMAQSYEKPEELVRWYYAQPQRLSDIEAVVIENNVVEWVLSKAKVTEKPADFQELMGHKKN